MPETSPPVRSPRRRIAGIRSLVIATLAAFAGGVAAVGVQFGVGHISAGYPPVVQALVCSLVGENPHGRLSLENDGATPPVLEIPLGGTVECRIEAPSADHATWSVVGPSSGIRAGPLDSGLPCQSPEDFAAQDPAELRLSACQRAVFNRPGLHRIAVTVMVRGHPSIDRATMTLRVMAPEAEPAGVAPGARLIATLTLPARRVEVERTAELSETFAEHGLWPTSRDFTRTVYKLAAGEEFVSVSLRANGAANASPVKLDYVAASRTVRARFTLRSGPMIDRWRGWISGTVVVRVRRADKANDIALPETALPVPGRVVINLPEGEALDDARIVLQRPTTRSTAELGFGGSAKLDNAMISARLADGALLLEAALAR